MIKSMTGFGRCEIMELNRKFTVEIKSVNHRFLDVNFKMPKKLSFFESSIRTVLKDYMQRGKVDVFITYEDYSDNNFALTYHEDVAAMYLTHLRQMAETFHLDNDIRVSTLSRYPEVFTMEEQTLDEKELWSTLEKALRKACEAFVEARIKEGENLRQDILAKLGSMTECVEYIESRSPVIMKEYRSRLELKVRELLENKDIDDARIVTEVTIFADKVCVDEETVRLKSHIATTRQALDDGDSIGRKLDFIAQELNREANTILSKSNDLSIADTGIQLKTDIEKIREQIQNIE